MRVGDIEQLFRRIFLRVETPSPRRADRFERAFERLEGPVNGILQIALAMMLMRFQELVQGPGEIRTGFLKELQGRAQNFGMDIPRVDPDELAGRELIAEVMLAESAIELGDRGVGLDEIG